MTVYELLDYCFDAGMLQVVIVKVSDDDVQEVYKGYGDEVPDELMDAGILTYDIPAKAGELTINIE